MSTETIPTELNEHLERLILSIWAEIDVENLKRCVEFVAGQVCYGQYSIPNKSQTQQLLETFSTKYNHLGYPFYADELSNCVQNYSVPDPVDKRDNVETKWQILEFLTKLSDDPFKTENLYSLEDKLETSKKAIYPEEITEEECINWYHYLREGHEKYQLPSDDEEKDEDYTFTNFNSYRETTQVEKIVLLYKDVFAEFDSKETSVADEKTTFLKALKDAELSKKWLQEHTQNSWWYEAKLFSTSSKYPTATFGIDWDRSQNTVLHSSKLWSEQYLSTKHQYLTEYKIIRQLLWLMMINDDKHRVDKQMQTLRTQISAPSLIQETFASFIKELFDTATKYHELRSFTDEIFADVLQMPFIYQAYASVLRNICNPFLQKIVEMEQMVRKQDDTNTLLKVRNDLNTYLREINFIHRVHCASLDRNWRTEPASKVASKLLSSVHSRFKSILNQSETRILLIIFFKTFKAYADLIDNWFTEGRLDDWKNEFFIRRSDDETCIVLPNCAPSTVSYASSCDQPVPSHQISEFFYKIADRLMTCSKNIDFLCKLNKTKQLEEEILKEGKLIEVLVNEFVGRILSKSSSSCPSKDPSSVRLVSEGSKRLPSIQFLSNDTISPYLVCAFQNTVNININSRTFKSKHIFEDLSNLPVDLELYPIGSIIEDSLYATIDRRESVIVDLFKSSLLQDYKLIDHLRTLSDLLLMDLHGFCNRLNIRLEKRIWEGNHLMKVFLHDAVESNKLAFGHLIHFTLDQQDEYTENVDVCVSEIIKVIDCVHLQYMVQWPMNMIFNDNVVKNFYEKLFKLVLKVNTAFSSVTRLYYKDLPPTKFFVLRFRRMQMFRYWVVQLLYRVRSYLSLIISQCLDYKMIEKNIQINTFSTLQSHYMKYLENCKKACLINAEINSALENALSRIWQICDHVRELWTKSTKLALTDQDVSRAVELYVQCLWYFTQVLEKFAKKGKRENNPLFNLWSDLAHMIEVHKSTIPEDLPFIGNTAEESFALLK